MSMCSHLSPFLHMLYRLVPRATGHAGVDAGIQHAMCWPSAKRDAHMLKSFHEVFNTNDDLCVNADTMVLYTEVLMREKCFRGIDSVKACSRELIAYLWFFNTSLNKLLHVRSHDDLHNWFSPFQSRLKQRRMTQWNQCGRNCWF